MAAAAGATAADGTASADGTAATAGAEVAGAAQSSARAELASAAGAAEMASAVAGPAAADKAAAGAGGEFAGAAAADGAAGAAGAEVAGAAEMAEVAEVAEFASAAAGAGAALDGALAELGWAEMLGEMPEVAVPLVFRLLGETGAQAPLINDVVLAAAGRAVGGTIPLPYAGGRWVVWERGRASGGALDAEMALRLVSGGEAVPLAAGRRALGWWLVGTSRAMLTLARTHVLDRVQFGRPLAAFQAVRHRLAETLVAIEGAEAALAASTDDDELGAVLAKAAAGQAAITAARHCQQVLGGIGFTAEHDLHRHVRRALVLDGLLGSTRELTREAGARLREHGSAPRLVHL